MKNKINTISFLKNYVIAIALSTLVFSSCEENESLSVELSTVEEPVKAVNNLLLFSNDKQLNETVNVLLDKTFEEQKQWGHEKGFTSIQTIFNDITIAEEEKDNQYAQMTAEELKKLDLSTVEEHSELYYKGLKRGTIKKEYYPEDGNEFYDINIAEPSLASICNEEGMFAVGDTIFQITPTLIKFWPNGDIDNLDVLREADQENDQIKFIVEKRTTLKGSLYPDRKKVEAHKGKRKIMLFFRFKTWQYLGNGTIWKYIHNLEFKSEKKNWRGKWKLNVTDMYVKGNWNGELKYQDPTYLSSHWVPFGAKFPSSGTKHWRGNWVRVCPSIIDGELGSWGSEWQIWRNYNGSKARVLDVSITDFYWEVTGHGSAKAIMTYPE